MSKFVSGAHANPELVKAFEMVQEWCRFNNVRLIEISMEKEYGEREVSGVQMHFHDDFCKDTCMLGTTTMVETAAMVEEENSR